MTIHTTQGATAALSGCPQRSFRSLILGLAALALVSPFASSLASAQRIGPPPPVTYDNKYEIYGGLSYFNFKAGENLTHRMNLGGAEIAATWWLNQRWGATAEYRGGAGTTDIDPQAKVFGIHRPLVFMNDALFGMQYRWLKGQNAALTPHAYGGIAMGVFDDGTQGAGPTPGVSATSNAQVAGLYADHSAPIIAVGAALDLNRSKNWALRLSPDLILEHFGNEEREFFSISGGIVYRFPLHRAKK
ncbi:MAG TPA: hypothetical protein VII58_10710 [Acidobacteriaceae bacterium]